MPDPRHAGSWPSSLEGLVGPSARAAGAVTLLSAQALDPAGAGAGGEAGERQGAEPHVFARHDELPEAFLVGEGVAGAPGSRAPHPPHAAVLGLLFLPHQLGIADLADAGGEHRGRASIRVAVAHTAAEKGPQHPGQDSMGQLS